MATYLFRSILNYLLTLFLGLSCCGLGRAQTNSKADTLQVITNYEFAYPFWSPDGTQIVFQSNFTRNWQLYVRNQETNKIHRLMEHPGNDVTPAWSPDGTKILFTSDRDGDEEIYTYDLITKEVKQITNNTNRDIHPNWSPDGKRIIFNADRKDVVPEKLVICVMNADGSQVKIIKEDEHINSYASFSPDGKKIAFLKWMDKGNNGEIFLMNADGTGETRLTSNTTWDAWPTWSSNGDKVIYSSSQPGAFKICEVDINTKKVRQLTFGNDEDARANCSKDGRYIVFNRGASGKIDIVVFRILK